MKAQNIIKSTKSELDKQIDKKVKEAKKRELKELQQTQDARIEPRTQEKKPNALISENNKYGYIIELIKKYKTLEELDTDLKNKYNNNLELLNKFVAEEKAKKM